MEMWARQKPHVQFLCVCVESLGVAQQFHRLFDFQAAVNSYIPGRSYMPRGYGQLGCSGFVIADPHGNFVSRKTSAYLQYGEQAFRHVEEILEAFEPASNSVAKEEEEVKENADASEEKRGQDETTKYHPASVGIASMDHEHETCAESLEILLEVRTEASLRQVLRELQHHFAHEEALMIQHGFGGDPTDPFSALTSHVKDHKRILDMAETELQRLGDAASSASCNAQSA